MKLSGTKQRVTLTVNGARCGVWVYGGPWVPGVDPRLIKIRSKRTSFPRAVREALDV